MANRILAITRDPSTTPADMNRVYLGPLDDGAGVVEADISGAYAGNAAAGIALDRCLINPYDHNKMMVVGLRDALFSLDDGATWAISTLPPWNGINRALVAVSATTYITVQPSKLYRSTDSGAIWAQIAGMPANTNVDLFFYATVNGYLLQSFTNPGVNGGRIYKTVDGGLTYVSVLDLPTLAGWKVGESPRRIVASTSGDTAYLLSSHGVWRITALNTVPVAVQLVVFDQVGSFMNVEPGVANIVLGTSGYDGLGADNYRIYDDLQVDFGTGRIWLGGYNALRAHSFDAGATWQLSNVASAINTPFNNRRVHHKFLDPSTGFAAYEQDPTIPGESGLLKSTNGGVTMAQYRIFSESEETEHLSAVMDGMVTGCTIEEACNYDADATLDDGQCQLAVRLSQCGDDTQAIHTMTPAITALTCHNPRFALDLTLLTNSANQQLNVMITGGPSFTFNSTISLLLTPQERVDLWLAELRTWLHANTVFTATPILPAQNPLNPGSPNAVWIEADSATLAGLAIIFSSIGFTGLQLSPTLDQGSTGSVVTVAEYPGICFKVCGTGDCALAQDLTLVGDYPNCFTCDPSSSGPIICRDCERMVKYNGIPLFPSETNTHVQCVSAGGVLDLEMNVLFPPRVSSTLTVTGGSQVVPPGEPMILTFPGDVTEDTPAGSQITTGPGGTTYTVASSSYDLLNDITTVITVENGAEVDPVETIDTFIGCACAVFVLLENVTTDPVTIVAQYEFPCVNNIVTQTLQLVIQEYASYRLTITARDCATNSVRTCTYWMDACSEFQVRNVDCHVFNVLLNRPVGAGAGAGPHTMTVVDLTTNEVLLSQTDLTDSSFPVQLLFDEDSVYRVTVTLADGRVWTEDIVDTCAYDACKMRLATELFCSDQDPCTAPPSVTLTNQRIELARIGVLDGALRDALMSWRTRTIGTPTYGQERLQDMAKITRIITVMREVALRCGLCEKQDPPCLNC